MLFPVVGTVHPHTLAPPTADSGEVIINIGSIALCLANDVAEFDWGEHQLHVGLATLPGATLATGSEFLPIVIRPIIEDYVDVLHGTLGGSVVVVDGIVGIEE